MNIIKYKQVDVGLARVMQVVGEGLRAEPPGLNKRFLNKIQYEGVRT